MQGVANWSQSDDEYFIENRQQTKSSVVANKNSSTLSANSERKIIRKGMKKNWEKKYR